MAAGEDWELWPGLDLTRRGWSAAGAGLSRKILISNFKLAWGRRESRGLKMHVVDNIERIQE